MWIKLNYLFAIKRIKKSFVSWRIFCQLLYCFILLIHHSMFAFYFYNLVHVLSGTRIVKKRENSLSPKKKREIERTFKIESKNRSFLTKNFITKHHFPFPSFIHNQIQFYSRLRSCKMWNFFVPFTRVCCLFTELIKK